MICTDKHVFLTHRSVGWWWFCWAHLGLLTLDFTLVWNSDLSHVVTAPSLGISCYLVYFLLLIMERHASNPAHKIKPMVLTWAFETLCILTISFPPPPLFSPYSSQIDFCPRSSMIHVWPYLYFVVCIRPSR